MTDGDPYVKITLSELESPLGVLGIAVSDQGFVALEFVEADQLFAPSLARCHAAARFERDDRTSVSDFVTAALRAYFAGDLHALDMLPIAIRGTEFQTTVWAALRKIPAGQVTSYQAIATAIGKPKAVRAVGAANGANPIALVVPCHRVIAANGNLCGYASGLWRKEWLLRHERALLV